MPGGIHPPLEVMASWPKPNYNNPQTQPKLILILACILGPTTIGIFFARLWVRMHMQHNAGWDDWLMLAAMIPIIAMTVLTPLVTEVYGFNKHVWDVQPHFFPIERKYVMAMETIFCVGSGLIKISILLFYRRLSTRAISSAFRWATWISIGLIASYTIAFSLVPIFLCNPISAFWEQVDLVNIFGEYKYKCLNEGADVFAAGVLSTVQDLLTAVLPTFLYWNLQMPFRQKLALFGIFAMGYGVVVIGALRTYASWQIFFETYDVTWVSNELYLWTLLELHVGAMCANAPALKVFCSQSLRLERFTSRGWSRSKNSSTAHSGSVNSMSVVEKLSFWKHNKTHSNNGYQSEPHTDVSIDTHGGLQNKTYSKRGIQSCNSLTTTRDSIDIMLGQYDNDIEMGSVHSTTQESKVHALPPMPCQPSITRPTTISTSQNR